MGLWRTQAAGRVTTTSWREVALATVAELRTLARWLAERQAAAPMPGADGLLAGIEHHLDEARQAAEPDPGLSWWARLKAGVSGADVERAMTNVDAADALVLRLAPAAYEQAIMPSLLSVVRRHLPAGDPRRTKMEDLARERQPFDQSDGDLIAAAVRDAGKEARREIARVRSFRNVLLVTALLLSLLAAGVTVLGVAEPQVVPLCFEPEGEVVCPTREAEVAGGAGAGAAGETAAGAEPVAAADAMRDTADPWDVPLVQAIGLVAAAVASAVSLRNIRGTSTPYALPVALAVLKLPSGALTAFLGILLMRGGFVPGLSALDSSAQILAWAIVFGYAQQVLTRFVDEQARSVLDDVGGSASKVLPAR